MVTQAVPICATVPSLFFLFVTAQYLPGSVRFTVTGSESVEPALTNLNPLHLVKSGPKIHSSRLRPTLITVAVPLALSTNVPLCVTLMQVRTLPLELPNVQLEVVVTANAGVAPAVPKRATADTDAASRISCRR